MANTQTDSKILRIGVIQGGKVIEERLIRRRATVTFGTDAKNTFVFTGAEVPKTWPLFEVKGGAYSLVFGEKMDGRVSGEGGDVDFNSLKSQDLAQKSGDKYRTALNDGSRGRVQFGGDLTILFHFVPAPPVAAKPELPLAARGGWVKSIEPVFTTVLTLSFLVHALMTIVVFNVDPPPPPTAEDVKRLIARVTPPKIETPPPPPDVQTPDEDPTAGDKKKPKKEEPKEPTPDEGAAKKGNPKKSAADRARAAEARRAAVRDAIQGKGLLAMIGTKGAGSGSVADVFKEGSSVGGDLQASLEGTQGVGQAQGDGAVTRRGAGGDGTGGSAAGVDDALATGGGGAVDSGSKKKTKIVPRVKAADISEVDGQIDKKGVASAIRKRSAAFQQCYETALKSDSKLQGKLVVEFTINEQGRVNDTRVVKDGLNSPTVARCVQARLKSLRFPKPADGEVSVTYPFVFTLGS